MSDSSNSLSDLRAEQITARVIARKCAATIIELASGEYEALKTDDAIEVFWAAIRDHALERAPLPPPVPTRPQVQPMTSIECRYFEEQLMPWDKFKGVRIGTLFESDPDYLDWLAAQPDEFRGPLNRYLMAMGASR